MVGSERAQRMSFACRITKATITIRICNTYHFSTVTVLRNLRINDRHCLLSPNSVFISDSQYSSWSSSWKHDEMKTCLDASVSDVHLGCLMTIGSTVSSFALFRARKRDLTDGGSEAWASCRQTDRQPETVGHVHVVLGLALPAGAILAEYKVVLQLGFTFLQYSFAYSLFPIHVHIGIILHTATGSVQQHPDILSDILRWQTAVCCGSSNNNEATSRKVAGSIPDGVIGTFH